MVGIVVVGSGSGTKDVKGFISTAVSPATCQLPPVLAIGPEGGWTDEEVAKLIDNGFRGYSLGSRILRTDTATIALLAQLMKEFGQC